MRTASSSSLRIGDYRRLKSSFSRNSRSSSATHLSLPLSPPSTIFTFARRADRKSIHLRAKSATRNRFRPEPYAARQFPTTIPSRGPRGVSRPSVLLHPASRIPPGRMCHVLEKRRRHRWRRNIAPVSSYRSRLARGRRRTDGGKKLRSRVRDTRRRRESLPSPLPSVLKRPDRLRRDYITSRSRNDRRNYAASRASEIAPRADGTRINKST